MLGEHLQAGRITGERETQHVEPFPGALPQLRVEAPRLRASFTAAQPMRTASGMASAMPDAPPLRPREGGRSRSSARGGSGKKNFLFLLEIFLEI